MPKHDLKMKLAKVLIAAAWADGRLANEELAALKDFLFKIPSLADEDWKRLMVYMDSPISEDDVDRLVDDLMRDIHGRKDRELVVSTLEDLIRSDGVVTDSEREFVDEIKGLLDATSTGFFKLLKGSMKRVISRRKRAVADLPDRESSIGDYSTNEVYHYAIHAKRIGDWIELPDDLLRKLCLEAGLLAWTEHHDLVIGDAERKAMRDILLTREGVTPAGAAAIVDAACERVLKGVDLTRLCRTYYETSNEAERIALLKSMPGQADHSKAASISEIARHLRVG